MINELQIEQFYSLTRPYSYFNCDLFTLNHSEQYKNIFEYIMNNPINIDTNVTFYHPFGDINFNVKIKLLDEEYNHFLYPNIKFREIEVIIDNVKITNFTEEVAKICKIAIADYLRNFQKNLMNSSELSLQTKLNFIKSL